MYGLELPLVQSLVGHMTPEMTKMYMDHAPDGAKRAAMQRSPNFLGEAPSQKALPAGSELGLVEEIRERLEGVEVSLLEAILQTIAKMIEDRKKPEGSQ